MKCVQCTPFLSSLPSFMRPGFGESAGARPFTTTAETLARKSPCQRDVFRSTQCVSIIKLVCEKNTVNVPLDISRLKLVETSCFVSFPVWRFPSLTVHVYLDDGRVTLVGTIVGFSAVLDCVRV